MADMDQYSIPSTRNVVLVYADGSKERITGVPIGYRNSDLEEMYGGKVEIAARPLPDDWGKPSLRNLTRAAGQGVYATGDEVAGTAATYPLATTSPGAFAAPPPYAFMPPGQAQQPDLSPGALDRNITAEREGLRAFEEQSPGVAYPAEIVPGLMSPGGATNLVPKLSRPASRFAMKNLVKPAAGGAAFGVGLSESDTLSGTLDTSASGAVGGIVLNTLLGTIAKFGAPVTRGLLNRAARTDDQIALSELRRAMVDDGVKVEDAEKIVAEIGRGGVLADVGPNVRQLFDDALQRRGIGKTRITKMLDRRTKGRYDSIRRGVLDADEQMGAERFWEEFDRLQAERIQIGDAWYDEAYQIQIGQNEKLDRLIALPVMQDVKETAYNRLTGFGYDVPQGMRLYDYMKRELDDKVSELYRQGKSNQATDMRDLRNEFVSILDNATRGADGVSVYQQARNAYAGNRAAEEALWLGYDALRQQRSIEHLRRELRTMGDHEREMARLGIFQSMLDDIVDNGNTSSVANRVLNNARTKQIIAEAFGGTGTSGYANFVLSLTQQLRQSELTKLLNNSLTGARMLSAQQGQRGMAGEVVGTAADAALSFGGALKALIRGTLRAVGNFKGELSDEALDRMAEELTKKVEPEQIRYIFDNAASLVEPGSLSGEVEQVIRSLRLPVFRATELGQVEEEM